MTFSIDTPIKAKVRQVQVLSKKDRKPDENVGMQLYLDSDLLADLLVHFSGNLRSFLLTKKAGPSQPQLEGMGSDAMTSEGSKIGWFNWRQEFAGYRLVIDQGIGGESNITLTDCTVDNWHFKARDGGVSAKYRVASQNLDLQTRGKLTNLKSCEITIQLLPPEIRPGDGDDLVDRANRKGRSKPKTGTAADDDDGEPSGATKAFIESQKGQGGEARPN